jgi:hypothetical protein
MLPFPALSAMRLGNPRNLVRFRGDQQAQESRACSWVGRGSTEALAHFREMSESIFQLRNVVP